MYLEIAILDRKDADKTIEEIRRIVSRTGTRTAARSAARKGAKGGARR